MSVSRARPGSAHQGRGDRAVVGLVALALALASPALALAVALKLFLVAFLAGHVVGVALARKQIARVTVAALGRAGGLARIRPILRRHARPDTARGHRQPTQLQQRRRVPGLELAVVLRPGPARQRVERLHDQGDVRPAGEATLEHQRPVAAPPDPHLVAGLRLVLGRDPVLVQRRDQPRRHPSQTPRRQHRGLLGQELLGLLQRDRIDALHPRQVTHRLVDHPHMTSVQDPRRRDRRRGRQPGPDRGTAGRGLRAQRPRVAHQTTRLPEIDPPQLLHQPLRRAVAGHLRGRRRLQPGDLTQHRVLGAPGDGHDLLGTVHHRLVDHRPSHGDDRRRTPRQPRLNWEEMPSGVGPPRSSASVTTTTERTTSALHGPSVTPRRPTARTARTAIHGWTGRASTSTKSRAQRSRFPSSSWRALHQAGRPQDATEAFLVARRHFGAVGRARRLATDCVAPGPGAAARIAALSPSTTRPWPCSDPAPPKAGSRSRT